MSVELDEVEKAVKLGGHKRGVQCRPHIPSAREELGREKLRRFRHKGFGNSARYRRRDEWGEGAAWSEALRLKVGFW